VQNNRAAPNLSTANKRRFQRVIPLAGHPVEIQIMGTSFLEVLTAEDICVGGVAVRVPYGFSPEELSEAVRLIVTVPGAKCFMATGTIRHISGDPHAGKFGIEFTNLDEAHRAIIERYVQLMLARGRGA
jgi:c-di-GMP-binding flagellar brake protein YcgR